MIAYKIIRGDINDISLPDRGFDAMLSDPPYGLKFMGKGWDHGVPGADTWEGLMRTLRPGASQFLFGGTRTFHRLMVALEDAGAEIRDVIMYLYGSGMPKGANIAKMIDKSAGVTGEVIGNYNSQDGVVNGYSKMKARQGDRPTVSRSVGDITLPGSELAQRFEGYSTGLKPSYEPIIWGMKPLPGSFAENAAAYGVAGINVDASRIDGAPWSPNLNKTGFTNGGKFFYAGGNRERVDKIPHDDGRWPANVIHDGSDEVVSLFPHSASGATRPNHKRRTVGGNTITHGKMTGVLGDERDASQGTAARFFYTAKSSRRERHAGVDGFYWVVRDGQVIRATLDEWRETDPDYRATGNVHPTVKPLSLCKYLATMLLPPERDTPRTILVPFSGSGSEMIGALLAGWDMVVGIELEPDYSDIAEARLAWWHKMMSQLHTNDIDKILKFAYPDDPEEKEDTQDLSHLPLFSGLS